jgi:hypothetical protein
MKCARAFVAMDQHATDMPRADLVQRLAALTRLLADRVAIVRVFINPDGTEGERIVTGYFRQPPQKEQPR